MRNIANIFLYLFLYLFFNLLLSSCVSTVDNIRNNIDSNKGAKEEKTKYTITNQDKLDLSFYINYEHGLEASTFVFSHNSSYIAIGSANNGKIIIYDVAAKKVINIFASNKNKDSIEALVFSADDSVLFAYSYNRDDRTLNLTKFNIKNSNETKIFDAQSIFHSHAFFSSSGRYLSYWSSGSDNSRAKVYTIYDLNSESIVTELNYRHELLFFDASEKFLIGLKNHNMFESISINNKKLIKEFSSIEYSILVRKSITTDYNNLIAAGAFDDRNDNAIIYSLSENKLINLINVTDKFISSLAFSPGEKFLMSAASDGYDKRVKMWDTKNGAFIKALDLNPDEKIIPGGLVFSPNAKYFVALGQKTLFIWMRKH